MLRCCFGKSEEETMREMDEIRASILPRSPSQYYSIYSTPAGRIPILETDEYPFFTYNKSINFISATTTAVKADYAMLVKAHNGGQPIVNELMRCNMSNDALLKVYRDFFCNSAYRVDDQVQHRKDVAVIGESHVRAFKRNLDKISEEPLKHRFENGFAILVKMQTSADELIAHFYASFAKPRLPQRGTDEGLTEEEKEKFGLN
uniref:Uncharacterized protein n=1 Tax=Caenorhabditis tropicalis TaxID=1561998 RepID=A0A1I7TQ22_9PELO